MKTSKNRDNRRDKKRNQRKYGHRSDGRGYLCTLDRKNNERNALKGRKND